MGSLFLFCGVWQTYLYVSVVYCCGCLIVGVVCFLFLYVSSLELGCSYKLSLCMFTYMGSYGEFVLGFTGNDSH